MSRPGHGHGHAQWRVTLEPGRGGGGGGGGEAGVGFSLLFCSKHKTFWPKLYWFLLVLVMALVWMFVMSCLTWKMYFDL